MFAPQLTIVFVLFINIVTLPIYFAHGDEVPKPQVNRSTRPIDRNKAIQKELPIRFSDQLRELFFAGLEGDKEAFGRMLEITKAALDKNPRHAEAMTWCGAYYCGKFFTSQDKSKDKTLWVNGLKDLDEAVRIAPDNLAALIVRATILLPAGRNAPHELGRPWLEKARGDLERTYVIQKDYLDEIGEHPLGELRMGLADVYRLLGDLDKSNSQLKAIRKQLPDTAYADQAVLWLAAPPDKKLAHSCIGCHAK